MDSSDVEKFLPMGAVKRLAIVCLGIDTGYHFSKASLTPLHTAMKSIIKNIMKSCCAAADTDGRKTVTKDHIASGLQILKGSSSKKMIVSDVPVIKNAQELIKLLKKNPKAKVLVTNTSAFNRILKSLGNSEHPHQLTAEARVCLHYAIEYCASKLIKRAASIADVAKKSTTTLKPTITEKFMQAATTVCDD